MCNASDYAVGDISGQQKNKVSHAIYFASKTLNEPQFNYATIEKELLSIVFAFDKFRPYLIGNKVIVFMDHLDINQIFNDKEGCQASPYKMGMWR